MPLLDPDTKTEAAVAFPSVEERTPVVPPSRLADLEHPWLGLESFREETRAYFFGRDVEIAEIYLRLRSHPLLVLYGRSGLGKTSILRAGLLPRLTAASHRPAIHRLDYSNKRVEPAEQLLLLLFISPQNEDEWRYESALLRAREWATELREKLGFDLPSDSASWLWLRLHWSRQPPTTTHLILDQFEEVFTLGAQRPGAEHELRDALAILLQGMIPAPISELIAKHDSFLDQFDTDSTPVRVVLALRDDYVYALNRWKRVLPALGQNNFELGALRGPAALDAVFKPGELRCHYDGQVREENEVETGMPPIVTPETAKRIVRFVAKKGEDTAIEEIEAVPPILSLLCRELNERRFTEPGASAQTPAEQITFSESDADVETIIKSFYERCVTRRPEAVRIFIEEELVSYSGARLAQDEKSILSCFEKGWKTPGAADGRRAPGYSDPAKARNCLEDLVNQRLLTSLGGDNPSYELIHDLLAAVVEKSRLTREAVAQTERLRLEQAAQRRRLRRTAAVACALAVTLIATICGGYYFFFQPHAWYYRDFAKHNGFAIGIAHISESEASRLPVSFRLIHKGIVRDGWKLHWKPAFRVEAVNGFLELTTNHSVLPYLWKGESESEGAQDSKPGEKGEQLGLETVCQWEFVSTTKNEIIYERALDRTGRMVYALIYSPPGSALPSASPPASGLPSAALPGSGLPSAALPGSGLPSAAATGSGLPADAPGSGLTYTSLRRSGLSSTRLARFVGPNGFPQLQRDSAAEFVEIHYDEAGWEDRVMYLDGKGLPAAGPDSAFGQEMHHNDLGQLTCVLSLDADGHRMIDDAGNSGMQPKYDEKGYEIEATSVDTDLKPRPVKDGWVINKHQYDEFGRPCRLTYHDVNGEPVLSKKGGYHGWQAGYDEHGNQTVVTYLGLDRKPMLIAEGYATFKSRYDSRGNETQRNYYGVSGEPVLSKEDGYHGWQAEYDKQNRQTVVTYLGLDGKPMLVADGYATFKSSYDSRGNKTGQNYYGAKGEPVLSKKNGYHGWQAECDEHGNQTVVTYLGLDGKPMLGADGYATFKSSYDSRGNKAGQSYYGVNGEPVSSKEDGYHGWQAEYDKLNRQTVVTYLGLDGKPMLSADGYATFKSSYDSGNNKTRENYYGVNGEPVLSKKGGYHGWQADYDERGNQTVVTYLGLDGKPILVADGYATFKSSYDSRGNEIRRNYYGVTDEPVLKRNGYHGWQAEYDDQNQATVATYLGLDGKPILVADGYATFKFSYDSRGNKTGQNYYGVKGEPVLSKEDGYHGWHTEYDGQNRQTVVTYLGLDGKPMLGADGYATFKSSYDSRGNKTGQNYYGVNGEPVLSKENGYHGWQADYDDHDQVTGVTYLGLDGKPLLLPAH